MVGGAGGGVTGAGAGVGLGVGEMGVAMTLHCLDSHTHIRVVSSNGLRIGSDTGVGGGTSGVGVGGVGGGAGARVVRGETFREYSGAGLEELDLKGNVLDRQCSV
jgi:hypothetical protein